MIEWKFDSCSCIINYSSVAGSSVFTYEQAIQMCKAHNGLSGQALLDEVIVHGQLFNAYYGSFDETDPDYLDKQDKIKRARAIEKTDIENTSNARTTTGELDTLFATL